MKQIKFKHLILSIFFVVLIIAIAAVSVSAMREKTKHANAVAVKHKPIPFVTWSVKEVVVGEQNGEEYRRGQVVVWHVVVHYTNGVVGSSPVIPPNLAFFLHKDEAQKCTGTLVEPAAVGTTEGSDATFVGTFDTPLISGIYYLDACKLTNDGKQYTTKSGYFSVA